MTMLAASSSKTVRLIKSRAHLSPRAVSAAREGFIFVKAQGKGLCVSPLPDHVRPMTMNIKCIKTVA